MTQALVIGGTRFIGRHTVEEFLDYGYDVTIMNRGNHENPFRSYSNVDHVQGNRRDQQCLEAVNDAVEPDAVVDCVGYHPADVGAATEIFRDADAYVFVSSAAAYAEEQVPKREDKTALCECTTEQAVDDTAETYGPRKAESDRRIFEAAEDGVNAMSIRPTVVYGPHDYKPERRDYWIDRVLNYDHIAVPGDGTSICHLGYVEDLACAIRLLVERGTPGEAYNFGNRRVLTLNDLIQTIATVARTDIKTVQVSERELTTSNVRPNQFPLYRLIDPTSTNNPVIHSTGIKKLTLDTPYPQILSTTKLSSIGWSSTPVEQTLQRTVDDYVDSGRGAPTQYLDRESETALLEDVGR